MTVQILRVGSSVAMGSMFWDSIPFSDRSVMVVLGPFMLGIGVIPQQGERGSEPAIDHQTQMRA